MEVFVDRFYALLLFIAGISHLTQPTKWRDFFRGVFSNPFGSFIIASFTLPVGLLVVSAQPHWSWDAHGVVTALGWGALVKGSLHLCWPKYIVKLSSEMALSVKSYVIVGAFMTVGGAYLVWRFFFE